MSSKILQISALIVAVFATGWAHVNLPVETRTALGEDFVPAPHLVDLGSMGFDALLADYYWLQAIQVAGSHDTIGEDAAGHLGKLIDVVTTVNPHVGHPYRFAAVWMTHSYEQVQDANRLLERAIEYHAEDWRNYFYLGFNQFYYLGDFEGAAATLELAAGLPGSPIYLSRLVARLKSERGDIELAEVFLRELLESTIDEGEIAKLESGLDEIEIEQKARHLDRARSAYHELSGRDIRWVGDLIRGPHRVLEKLPSPEPDSMPSSLARGSVWEIGDDGRIVSSYLGHRYEVHFSAGDAPFQNEASADGAVDTPGAAVITNESSTKEGDRLDG